MSPWEAADRNRLVRCSSALATAAATRLRTRIAPASTCSTVEGHELQHLICEESTVFYCPSVWSFQCPLWIFCGTDVIAMYIMSWHCCAALPCR